MDHESPSNTRRVNGGFRSTWSLLRIRLGKKRLAVVLPRVLIRRGEYANDFTPHSGVCPELAAMLEGSPDGGAGGDGVDATEHGFAGGVFGTPAVGDRGDGDRRIDLVDLGSGCCDFELAEVALQVALGGDVGRFDSVKVDQLDLAGTDSCELKGDLTADGAYADDGGRE